MDYSKMTDFEINKAIVHKTCPQVENLQEGADESVWFSVDGYSENKGYCNNPADAWPIIVSNHIGLNFVNGAWRAQSMFRGYDECVHENPLRAAMIVYLMMQEAK